MADSTGIAGNLDEQDAVFTVNAQWEISSFNRAAEHLFGLKAKKVLGKKCHDVFGTDSRFKELFSTLCPAVAAGKMVTDFNLVMKNLQTGEPAALLATAVPIPGNEHPAGAIITFRDAAHSTVFSRLIIDSIADGVFTVDRSWQITSFNLAAENITGWKRQDAIGRFCGEVFHSSICGRNCAIAQSLYGGKPVSNRSITIGNKNGRRVPISICAAPLTDHEGNIIGGVETFRDISDITMLQKKITKSYSFNAIISKSAAMQQIFSILPEIARSRSNVLLLGESGTGKELVARAIVHAGDRREQPFVAVNCGALPATLLESELFGYKAGAFTDAKKDRPGRFAAAEGGTLFLDEIGDIPNSVQVKLLRVLQNREYEPLGASAPIRTDVRIITATNRDLQAMVNKGTFREDLFYRLNVVKINLPPLRERMEDVPLLIDHFIRQYSTQQHRDIVGISNQALAILMHYDYPGNIRELENIIEYAFILCEKDCIEPEHLPDTFITPQQEQAPSNPKGTAAEPKTLEEMEKQTIYDALERNNWKRMATCRELGISKDTLRRKIGRFNLKNPLEQKMTNTSAPSAEDLPVKKQHHTQER